MKCPIILQIWDKWIFTTNQPLNQSTISVLFMRRTDLEHITRAAGSITQDDEIIILRQRVSMLKVEESIKDRILKRIGR